MPINRCIAKAYGNEPLDRLLPFDGREATVVVNPSCKNSIDGDYRGGVNFPKNCLFEADDALFSKLRSAYDSGDDVLLAALWGEARLIEFERT